MTAFEANAAFEFTHRVVLRRKQTFTGEGFFYRTIDKISPIDVVSAGDSQTVFIALTFILTWCSHSHYHLAAVRLEWNSRERPCKARVHVQVDCVA